WDAEIKQQGLHLKYDPQLVQIDLSLTNKIPRVLQDLNDILRFPDAKRLEIYNTFVEAGEITALSDAVKELPKPIKDKIDAELQHELDFYQTKWEKLCHICVLISKEQEFRLLGLVERKPKGSTYYVDFDNGDDTHDGTHTAETDSNEDGPWATLDKCGSTLTAGDIAIVRRGMTQTVSADLAFTNSGTLVAPITIEADYADSWGDDSVAGETATLIFGSKTVTFADDISGDIAAHDWIYEATEDNTLFAYEVASVSGGSNEIVTLYLPYKGAISGAGKTINIMPDNPIWNTAAGSYQVNLDGDNYWKFQGIHFRGTHSNGNVEFDGCTGFVFKDCIFTGNNSASDIALRATDDAPQIYVKKCRSYDEHFYVDSGGAGSAIGVFEDCLFDANSIAACAGVDLGTWTRIKIIDCEFANTVYDIRCDSAIKNNPIVRTRNCIFSGSTDEIENQTYLPFSGVYVEDYDATVGDNRQYLGLATADSTPV
ncbi:unnamed protein product, partial [marine sediment metagenome]